MNEHVLSFLFALTNGLLVYYIMMFMEFKAPKRLWQGIWVSSTLGLMVATALVRVFYGEAVYSRICAFTVTIPSIILTIICSSQQPWVSVFNVCNSLYLGGIVMSVSTLTETFITEDLLVLVLIRLGVYTVTIVLMLRVKTKYQQLLALLDKGWGILSAIPLITFMAHLYVLNLVYPADRAGGTVTIVVTTLLCTTAYIVVYIFYDKVIAESLILRDEDMAYMRSSALSTRTMGQEERIQSISNMYLDMQRKWQSLSRLIQEGREREVLALAGEAEAALMESVPYRWCPNNTINAVLIAYFTKAESAGIRIDAVVRLTKELEVKAPQLATVLANALDNAINACKKLPPEERVIICRIYNMPTLLIQISNPYTGEISFGRRGLPIAEERGHGFGTHSIAAFCETYNCLLTYRAENNWLTMRISL